MKIITFQDTKGTRKIARFSKSKYKDKDNNAKIDEKAFYANSVMGPLLSSKFVRPVTGKSLSETLIFALTNPQYDDRLFIELQAQYMKIPTSNLRRTSCVHKLF